jgi:outer membrane PBP1 activator LpoA protein
LPKVPGDIPEGARLVALGLDAYRLLSETRGTVKPDYSLEGATGVLRVGTNQTVTRQLTCARFDKSLPIIQGLAPKP